MNFEHGYRATRQAWIDGVNEYYPGTPKPSYVKPWDELDAWEREAVIALYDHVRLIILPSLQAGIRIPQEYGGYLVGSIWNILMFQILHNPKPSYISHFDQLSEWQQKTDTKMFVAIEAATLQEILPRATAS
jgi:hypothetical protein